MIITPQKLAVKYNPPRICLIYSCQKESFFHDFFITSEDLKLSTSKLYNKLKAANPGYLENIEKNQITDLIELIKQNSNKGSKAQRLRGIISEYKASEESDHSSDDHADHAGIFDFNQVENQFESSSSNSQIDLEL